MPKCLSRQRGIIWSNFHKIKTKFIQVIFTLVPNSLQNFKSLAKAIPEIFCLQAFNYATMLKSTKGQNLVYFSFKLLHTRALWFQRRRSFSHFKSMRAVEPRGVANLDPRGMVGRIYVGDHLTLLHTKYLSSGPYDFREEDFLSFSHFKSIGVNEP